MDAKIDAAQDINISRVAGQGKMHIIKMNNWIRQRLHLLLYKVMLEHSALKAMINARFNILLLMLLLLASPATGKETPVIVVLGDSLTAGYGLPAEDAFPQKLQKHLSAQGIDVIVENAGVSGDTTQDGLARLDWSISPQTDAVILELGANDALRGLPPAHARANLEAILQNLRQRKIPVLLTGMLALRSLGEEYSAAFDGIYPQLAEEYDVPLYPFFLKDVVGEQKLNQPDMLHPNAAGVDVIVKNITPYVIDLLNGL